MKILISLISYQFLTGSELYVYEISKELKNRGHEVLITAPIVGGDIKSFTEKLGIEVYSFEDCPMDWDPDIMHLNEYMPSLFALTAYSNKPAVASVHSQFNVELPFLSSRIYKYICIRPEIQKKIVTQDGIIKDKTTVIYNGVDFKRFKPIKKPKIKNVLFVGTIDPLRRISILDLIEDSKKNNYRVTIVGQRHANYLDNAPSNVFIYPPTWNIEKYLNDATETAGILLGRTTIEGWACGLPCWIYDIDLEGNIISKKLHEPPEDMNKFNSKNVAGEIEKLYKKAIEEYTDLNSEHDSVELSKGMSKIIGDTITSKIHINNIISSLEFLHSENQLVHNHLQKMRSELDDILSWRLRLRKRVNKIKFWRIK